jgi:hypothetical protein
MASAATKLPGFVKHAQHALARAEYRMSRSRFAIPRRTFLRGLLGGVAMSVALPPLEAMFNASGTAYACGGPIPKRFGLWFWGNGNIPDRWTPTGEGTDYALSEQLAPLANVKDVISVVSGMSVKLPNLVPHSSGAAGILSGAPLFIDDAGETFTQPSIDQVIAAAIGNDTIYRSIQTAATPNAGLSYNGPNNMNPPESDPYALYQRLFGPSFREPGDEGVVDPTIALRRSVLDAVRTDANALKGRLGAVDQARLDQHLTGIEELESRLQRLQEDPPNLEACGRPLEPLASYPDIDGRPQISARNRVMADLLAMALACDQTRVFGHYLTQPVNNYLFPGASQGHHELTHNEAGDQPEVNSIVVQCITEFAYFVETLRNVPEADGTLLDNCALLCTSDVSLGRTHSLDEMPIVIAGTACGALRTGLHYRSIGQENASMVLLTLIRAMGLTAAEFGVDEAHTTSGLSAIEA